VVIVSPATDPRGGSFGAIQLGIGNPKNSDIIEGEQIADMPICDPTNPDKSDPRLHAEAPGDCTPQGLGCATVESRFRFHTSS